MATTPVPSLSSAGWVRAPAEKADYLMSHWLESDKAQTALYGSKVTNLQYTVEQYGHDPLQLVQSLRSDLEDYLRRYYDAVLVETTTDASPANTNPLYTINIYIEVTELGQVYSFGYILSAEGTKVGKLIKMNNTGETS